MKQTISIACVAVLHLLAQPLFAPHPESPISSTKSANRTLRIYYESACDARGWVASAGRRVRFDLWRDTKSTELFADNDALHFDGDCRPARLSTSWRDETDLVMRHSPYIVVRADQAHDRETDVPLALTHSIVATSRGTRMLRYTVYFTDEDSQSTTAGAEFQMARYGRRTDIEWVYEVELGLRDEVVGRFFQGDVFMGAGHRRYPFRGRFVAGTEHPILYDIATHNVFSDRGTPRDAYALVPREKLVPVEAREALMFRMPWLFAVSDRELAREGKLARAYDEYVYVRLDGKLTSGGFTAELTLADGTVALSGGGEGDIDRLGEDLWGRQSFTAIPVGKQTDLRGAWLRLRGAGDLTLTSVGFLRFGNGVAVEVPARCDLAGMETRCTL